MRLYVGDIIKSMGIISKLRYFHIGPDEILELDEAEVFITDIFREPNE